MKINNITWFLGIFFFLLLFWAFTLQAKENGKVIVCDEYKAKTVRVATGRLTVINFPVTPKEIMPGEATFDFKQLKNDLAIKSLRPGAKTNIFVYMQERRCSFNLVTVSGDGDDILYVRDPKDRQIEVKFHD
ncbi:MAG: hypothetical protein IPM57_02540 [Oligoflexia bacterium]|nr:hypothetical protein [Oligoflexia bacterium]